MAARTAHERAEIRVLGELEVRVDGSVVALPQSKKTRALLAYLVLTGRTQRRERLTALLWDVADDPRGALRWSLSKLRSATSGGGADLITSERDSVGFDRSAAWVDVLAVRDAMARGEGSLSTGDLEALAATFRGELLEGLDLPDFHDYQAWCSAEREQARRERARILQALVQRLAEEPEKALPHARELSQVESLDEEAHAGLLSLLLAAGRTSEARQYLDSARRLLGSLETRRTGALDRVWQARGLQSTGSSDRPVAGPPSPAEPPVSRRAPLGPLVGREDETRALEQFLDRAREKAAPSVVLVTGEPGVGKSRLLAELSSMMRAKGGVVLSGRAFEAEAKHPYAPWLDALRRDGSGDLVQLLSQSGGSTGSREDLFAGLATRVRERCRDGAGLLLAFDDVQWCDEASAELLHYVVRAAEGCRLWVALGARAGELVDNAGVTRLLRSLRRERVLTEMPLGPLSREATALLVRGVAEGADPGLVFERSAGNPLFALELARGLSEAQGAEPPESLAVLVRERVERLPPTAVEALRWAAVMGRAFDPVRLEPLTGVGVAELARHLEILERHQLLSADESGGASFSHDVVRAVVYSDVSEPRRRLMHLSVARELSKAADDDEALAADLAHHAGLAGDPGLAARATVRAARRALRLFASAEAFSLSRMGRAHAETLPEKERVPLIIELAQVSYAARPPERRDVAAAELQALGARALELGQLGHARLAFHTLAHLGWEGGAWGDAERYSREAERIGRASSESERVMALGEAGRCLVLLERDLGHADALLLEAQALARRIGVDSEAVSDGVGLLRLHEGRHEEAEASFRRARATAKAAADGAGELQALEHLVLLEVSRGRFDVVAELATELEELAGKHREGSELPFARALRALAEHARTGGAHEAIDRAVQALRDVDAKHRLAFTLTRAAVLDLERGDVERAGARAREALSAARALDRPSEMALALGILAGAAFPRESKGEAAAPRSGGGAAEAREAEAALREIDLRRASAEIRTWLAARSVGARWRRT